MEIAICLKPVKSSIVFKDSKHEYMINPYDLFSLELIKKVISREPLNVTAILMGRLDTRIISQIKLYGINRIIYANDNCFSGSDTFATSYVLCSIIKSNQFDYIICGKKAVDGETGHIAPSLARRLDYNYLSEVQDLDVINGDLCCIIQDGNKIITYKVEASTVIETSSLLIKEVPLSLFHIKNIQNVSYELITSNDLSIEKQYCGLSGSKTKVIGMHKIEHKCNRERRVLNIDNEEHCQIILKVLTGEYNEL